MKPAIFAVLLFFCAAEGISPKLRSEGQTKLKHVFHGSKHIVNQHTFGYEILFGNLINSAKINGETDDQRDETEDSMKGKPGARPVDQDIAGLLSTIPKMTNYLKPLKEKRDKEGNALAKQFVEALKTDPNDTRVKTLFGKHIRELHQSCELQLLTFAKAAKASGLFKHSELFEDIIGNVIEKVEEGSEAGFIKEFLTAIDKKEVGHHIFVKVLIAVGGLFVDAACDLELDGYGSAIADLIKKEQAKQAEEDEGANFCCRNQADDISKINCTCEVVKKALNQGEGYLQRQYRLLFQGGCDDQEAYFVSYTLSIIKIMAAFAYEEHKIKKEIIDLHVQNNPEEADLVLANYVLSILRRATLVGIISECEEKSDQGKNAPDGSRDELRRTYSKAKALFNRKRKL